MSMRSMRVADALAEELEEIVSSNCAEGESKPAKAFVSQPDANATISQGAQRILRLVLYKNLGFRFFRWRIELNRRIETGSSLSKASNYLFKLSGRKLAVELNLGLRKV